MAKTNRIHNNNKAISYGQIQTQKKKKRVKQNYGNANGL